MKIEVNPTIEIILCLKKCTFSSIYNQKRKDAWKAIFSWTQPQGTEQSEIRPMAIMDYGYSSMRTTMPPRRMLGLASEGAKTSRQD